MAEASKNALSIDISAFDMPEDTKLNKMVMALAAEDADTCAAAIGYGVYAVSSSGSYAIMF